MKILAFDTSAQSASVALCEDGNVLSECQVHRRLTHSQTMLPMCEEVFRAAAMDLSEVELLAVSHGPGSFTGVRIGIAAVKGIAFANHLPCVGVSTLAALGRNLMGLDGMVCAAMDARRDQVYTALFRLEGERMTRLTEDVALALTELDEKLKGYGDTPITLVGDGAALAADRLTYPNLRIAPLPLRYGRAGSVAALAAEQYAAGGDFSAAALMPRYLRLPQAERERLEREGGKR